MAYNQQNGPQMGATFVPGGLDDFYIPAATELISPAPQRVMPEVPEQMQDNLAHLELEANESRNSQYGSQSSLQYSQDQPPNHPSGSQYSQYENGVTLKDLSPVKGQSQQAKEGQKKYINISTADDDLPNFSPFPRLNNPGPHIPPTDEAKFDILERARVGVLNSNDPEMQLAWSQDALAYIMTVESYEERIAHMDNKPARLSSPAAEHRIKEDAMNIVEFLAQQHHPKAEFMKGMWLEFGSLDQRLDKREAFRCYARSAENGYSRAEYRMGMQFEQNGDPMKAISHYQRGAAAGDTASNYRLGMASLNGQLGQPVDFGKALQMLRISAREADENAPQGAYVLGMLQARQLPQVQVQDILLPYDQQAARDNVAKSAYLGFAKAQVKMGSAYELCDLGCEFDPALSIHYNALAAKQGEAEAEMSLSKWFLCGHEGVFKKSEEFAYLYANRAAQTGLSTAEFAMGYFNEIGLHVPINLANARSWYEKAASKGNEDAKQRIEGLNKSHQLSKKDHENVAINRIRSQYGSKRGGRPARFSQDTAPPMPSMPEQHKSSVYGGGAAGVASQMALPPRDSSRTPYPMDDGPPRISAPERPATVTGGLGGPHPQSQSNTMPYAPYPLDDLPSQQQRPHSSFNNGLAPHHGAGRGGDVRRASSPGVGFGINPDIYQQQQQHHQGGQSHLNSSTTSLPIRPSTTLSASGGPRPLNSNNNNMRVPSGPPMMAGPNKPASAQYNGMGPPRKDSRTPSSTTQQIGYSAPLPNNNSNRTSQTPSRIQSYPNDIGYIAPLQPNKTRLSTSQIPPATHQQKPSSSSSSSSIPNKSKPSQESTSRLPSRSSQLQNQTPAPQSLAPTPASHTPPIHNTRPSSTSSSTPKPMPHPSLAPPKKVGAGPKTFEQMGVPAAQKESDCAIM